MSTSILLQFLLQGEFVSTATVVKRPGGLSLKQKHRYVFAISKRADRMMTAADYMNIIENGSQIRSGGEFCG